MQKPPWYKRNAWSVPVPVRPSHLQALLPEHQIFNVQVDLAQLTPFDMLRISRMMQSFCTQTCRPTPGSAWVSLYPYLTTACGHAKAASVDPAEIASALSARAEEGLRYYAAFLRTGVYWGSFSNNFALNGSFLDLEVPQIFGRPFFGVMASEPELCTDLRQTLAPVIECEAVEYLVQVRYFIEYLVSPLHFLLDWTRRQLRMRSSGSLPLRF